MEGLVQSVSEELSYFQSLKNHARAYMLLVRVLLALSIFVCGVSLWNNQGTLILAGSLSLTGISLIGLVGTTGAGKRKTYLDVYCILIYGWILFLTCAVALGAAVSTYQESAQERCALANGDFYANFGVNCTFDDVNKKKCMDSCVSAVNQDMTIGVASISMIVAVVVFAFTRQARRLSRAILAVRDYQLARFDNSWPPDSGDEYAEEGQSDDAAADDEEDAQDEDDDSGDEAEREEDDFLPADAGLRQRGRGQ